MPPKSNDNELNTLLQYYSKGLSSHSNLEHEVEVKFGTKGGQRLTLIQFEQVYKKFLAQGFQPLYNEQMLRIQNEYTDERSGRSKISNVRCEINGLNNIQEYCKTDEINTETMNVKFNQKMGVKTHLGEYVSSVEYTDFNFRISYNTERDIHSSNPVIKSPKCLFN